MDRRWRFPIGISPCEVQNSFQYSRWFWTAVRLHVLLLCIMNNIISCGKASQQNDVFLFYDYTFGSWVHSMCDPFDHIGPPCFVPLFNNLDRFVLCFGPTLVWQPRLVWHGSFCDVVKSGFGNVIGSKLCLIVLCYSKSHLLTKIPAIVKNNVLLNLVLLSRKFIRCVVRQLPISWNSKVQHTDVVCSVLVNSSMLASDVFV